MPISGTVCSDVQELKKIASKKKLPYVEKSIPNAETPLHLNDNWELVRQGKYQSRIRKQKSSDVFFEDRLWMIFYNLGFCYMNKDRNCMLELGVYKKQIDVLARDENNIFIVECRSSEQEEAINARKAITDWIGQKSEIELAIKNEWGNDCGKIHCIVAISSADKRAPDDKYIKENKDKNILLWSKTDIEYIEDLIRQVGFAAKYQLYSLIFKDRHQPSLRKYCPAIEGRIGGAKFYTFVISAKDMLKYAYVHHRDLTGIIEATQVYQRMLKHDKLKEIAKYIDLEDGYFPNSIIVNFSKKIGWEQLTMKKTYGDIRVGTIKLPEYYGSAWIIDGQHRLFGAARADKDVLVPVLAFENMDELEQANLFVHINEKQTKVPSDLMWDLYSDIYVNSTDERQRLLYQITETAKAMANSGPLSDYIDVPSKPVRSTTKLSFTTVCSTIQQYAPWNHLKHPSDNNKTPENASRIVNSYYEVLKSLWPEDWNKGKKGSLLTNNGFGVLIMLLHDIISHMVYQQKQSYLIASNKNKFEDFIKTTYITPLIEYLKTDEKLQNEIRISNSRGGQSDCAALLDLKIQEFVLDYSPPRIGGLPDITKTKDTSPISPTIPKIEKKAQEAEGYLRDYIYEKLKTNYSGNQWWSQGIPGGLKQELDKSWNADIKRKPYLREDPEQNKRKFNKVGLGDMIAIVVYGNNWDPIFEPIFLDKANFERRIKDVMALRNPVSHIRQMDDQDVVDGIGGLLWLSNCIQDNQLNPYV